MNLEDLEKQDILVEDIQEIENLQRMYGYFFDSQQAQNVVDLFSDNAESAGIESHGYSWAGKGSGASIGITSAAKGSPCHRG
jgi:hypothetical protein